jgi:general secretion pathway protein A
LHALRQLKQRIAIKARIMPLSREESLSYINHRLEQSLQNNAQVFTRRALSIIIREAKGIPRIINILCDNCLITSFGKGQKVVTAKVAHEIIAEQCGGGGRKRWIAAFAGLLLCLLSAAGISVVKKVAPSHLDSASGKARTGLAASGKSSVPAGRVTPVMAITDNHAPAVGPATDAPVANPLKPERLSSDDEQAYRIVRRGDTLAELLVATYGTADQRHLALVRRYNPDITDVNLIQEGSTILFPLPDGIPRTYRN